MQSSSVAIIGAGVAGMSCAHALVAHGASVVLFDKGRAPGGRIATRRVMAGGQAQFDHGAQYMTARDSLFQRALEPLIQAGSVQRWDIQPESAEPKWVGAPGMSAFCKAISAGLNIQLSKRIATIQKHGDGWRLRDDESNSFGPFDILVIATPAEQAAPLLDAASEPLAGEARQAITAPCWAGLIAFDAAPGKHAPTHMLKDHPVLDWIACDSAKPGRPSDFSCWVAHARSDWSRAHLEHSPDAVAPLLEHALRDLLSIDTPARLVQAHRWRFARVKRTAVTASGWDSAARVGVCGDWRLGPRVESAWLSGHALAQVIAS